MGAVSAQDDQTVQLEFVIGLLHGRHLVHAVGARFADGLEGGAAAAQEGAAFGEDAGEIGVIQKAEFTVNQSLIAVQKAVNLHGFLCVEQRLRHPAHGWIQRLAVAAAGQHTDSFHDGVLLIISIARPEGVRELK